MIVNILQYLERAAQLDGKKTLFSQADCAIAYGAFVQQAKALASGLLPLHAYNRPIVVCMDKSIDCLLAMFGTTYSGNCYTVLDTTMPVERAVSICDTLQPVAIITNRGNNAYAEQLQGDVPVLLLEDLLQTQPDTDALLQIRRRAIDTDPLYILFTSGSTGVPKGVVIQHRSVIAYAEWLKETFHFNADTTFGSQTPFYFSMSVLDLFSTLCCGGSLHIIPKQLFSFPVKLLEYMTEKEINTIYWVPSALSLVANWNAFADCKAPKLHTILFAGEVMPTKQLNVWVKQYPDALFANLFGPTEITDICTYYILDRAFAEGEMLPIGKACDNCDVLVLTEDGKAALPGQEGELCVRGSFLAMGYYNCPEKTQEVFVQNPLNPHYPELIYKTGDLVKYDENGELLYLGRRDFQIKSMGYRIELGEIEAAASTHPMLQDCACVYLKETETIVLVYTGDVMAKELMRYLRTRVPKYMVPRRCVPLEAMPHNANGKIDRKQLMVQLQAE